jgi:hypothetical protein
MFLYAVFAPEAQKRVEHVCRLGKIYTILWIYPELALCAPQSYCQLSPGHQRACMPIHPLRSLIHLRTLVTVGLHASN